MKKYIGAVTLGVFISSSVFSAALAMPVSATSNVASDAVVTLPADAKTTTLPETSKPKLSLEEAEKLAKKHINVPDGFKRESGNFEDQAGRKVWTFRWSKNENYKYQAIYVSVDADTGELRNYNHEDPSMWEQNFDFATTFTRKEAHEIALKFVKKYSGDKFPFLVEVEVPNYQPYYGTAKRPMARYNFRFIRQVDGIPFDDDGAWIDILENGKVASYNMNWTLLSKALPKPALKLPEAQKIFKEELGLKLTYVKDYSKQKPGMGEPTDTKLVYQVPDYFNFYIDAQTGEIKDFSGGRVTAEYMSNMKAVPETAADGKFYVEKGKLAKEDAYQIVGDKIQIPEGYELIATEYQPDYFSQRSMWIFRFTNKQDEKQVRNMEIAVAADNGELMRMNKFREYPPAGTKDGKTLTYEEITKKAQEFIEQVLPEKAKVVKLDPQSSVNYEAEIRYSPERWFHFTRYYNGIAVSGEGMGISVDTTTGEVINFDQQFTQANFKDAKGVLSVDKVQEKFFAKNGLKLSYFRVYKPGYYYGGPDQASIELGYRMPPEMTRQYDAYTGEPLYNNWDKPKQTNEYTKDIEKHKYAGAIKKLFDLNIMGGRTKDAFYPEQEITKAEFIKVLVAAKGLTPLYDNSKLPYKDVSLKAWYAPYVRAALAKGIITTSDKLNPTGTLTTEDASVMIVRALGYEKLAKLDIYKKQSAGIKKENAGFVAIAQGLKLFPEKDAKITRGETAQIIMNVLKNN